MKGCSKFPVDHTFTDFKWATQLNRVTLDAIGVWPTVHGSLHEELLSNLRTVCVFCAIIFIGVIPAIHSLVRAWGNMMSVVDNLQYTLPLITAILKLVVVRWKKTDLRTVINMIAEDWMKAKTKKELRVMIKRAQSARILTMLGYALMTLGLCLLGILPCFGTSVRYMTNITDPGKPLPLQTHYLYDKDRSPYFEMTFVAQILMAITAVASYSGVDSLLGVLVLHLCGQMENLRERLISMKQFKTFNGGLTVIVRDHIRLIKCFDIIESTFTLLLLGLLLSFGTLFSLCGFLIVTVLKSQRGEMSTIRLIYIISIVVNICVHMCLYCIVGEILVTQSEAIYLAAYDYKWYTVEPQDARALILVMIRASKPLHITAGKIFPMTMSMFCNLIKTCAGYVSVLLARGN